MDADQKTEVALTRRQAIALRLLARGGARYGTRHAEMTALRDMGLAVAHDTGKPSPGKWTWRPTEAGRVEIVKLGHADGK